MASNHNAINSGCGNAVSRRKFNTQSKTDIEPTGPDAVTVKRNPKSELSHDDLVKLLSCLEGELQAREIAIAVLKNEQVKRMLREACRGTLDFSDPLLALQRDGGHVTEPSLNVQAVQALSDAQQTSLERVAEARRDSQVKMVQYMEVMEAQYNSVRDELNQLKAKQQATDSCPSPELIELQKQLDTEKAARLKAEEEAKQYSDKLEQQQQHQKNIVLVLLAERNQIAAKYLEQCARSQTLSKMLSEEKSRVENMAEGLEEESKKSLLMEAELERHMSDFINEKHNLKSALAREEKRYQELMSDHEKLQRECERLKNQLSEAHQVAMFQASSVSQRLSGSGVPPAAATGPRAVSGGHHATLSSAVVTKVSSTPTGPRSTTAGSCSLAPPRVAVRRSSSPAAAAAHASDDRLPPAANLPQQQQQTAPMTSSGVAYSAAIGQRAAIQSNLSSSCAAPTARSIARQTAPAGPPGALGLVPARSSAPPPVCRSAHFPTGPARRPPLGRGVPPPVPPNKPVGMAGGVFSKTSNPPPPPPPPPHATSQVGVAGCAPAAAGGGSAPPVREHAGTSVVASEHSREQHVDVGQADASELEHPPPLPTSPPPLCSPSSLALVDCLPRDCVSNSACDPACSIVTSTPPLPPTSAVCDTSSVSSDSVDPVTVVLTCLVPALLSSDEEGVGRALETRPDLSEKTTDGDTAFHVAAACSSVECLRLLLQHWLAEFMTTDMLPVLLQENDLGLSVLQLCCGRDSAAHLRALVDFCPQLRAAACDLYRSGQLEAGSVSDDCRRFLVSAQPDSVSVHCCEICLECSGVVVSPSLLSCTPSSLAEHKSVAIGHLSVSAGDTWCEIWQSVNSLVTVHLVQFGRTVFDGHVCSGGGSCSSCPPVDLSQLFGITSSSSAVDEIQLGSVCWRPGVISAESPASVLTAESAVSLTVRLEDRADCVLTTLLTAGELTSLADEALSRDIRLLHVFSWPRSSSALPPHSLYLDRVYCDNLQRSLSVFADHQRTDLTSPPRLSVDLCTCSLSPISVQIVHMHGACAPLLSLASRVCRSAGLSDSGWVSAFSHGCHQAVQEGACMLPFSLSSWLSAVGAGAELGSWLQQLWSQQLVPCLSSQLEGERLAGVLQRLQTVVLQHCPLNPQERVSVSAALSVCWVHVHSLSRAGQSAVGSRNSRSPAPSTAAKKPAVRRLAPLLKKLPSVPRQKNSTSRPLP